jgi:DNA-entry nuclease
MEIADIPIYSGEAYCEINGNVPYFSEDEMVTEAFENYSDLDFLGRCGVAYANICKEIMPTEERGEIGMIKPSGWHTVKYNDRIDGNYLYNRCHLIGYQLTGENANRKNLITGTRYLNVTGMLPFENMVADYVKETDQHVMYRVTPVFEGDNLLAAGVLMEGKSVEDNGEGVLFCVFAYNVQPGVSIDYATGESSADGTIVNDTSAQEETSQSEETQTYVLNTNTHKFHKPGCYSVEKIKPENYAEFTGTREEAIAYGYDPCKNCNP